jgi:protein-tyrosine phosphatase
MFREVSLPREVAGRLYLHAMPGRDETWDEFVREAERLSLDALVCLASEDEIRAKSPAYFRARSSGTLPVPTKDFPIEDFGVPGNEERSVFRGLVREVAAELRAGKGILIHCRMGIGRTGLLASLVLVELGLESDEAIRVVETAGSSPEVKEQRRFVAWYCSSRE